MKNKWKDTRVTGDQVDMCKLQFGEFTLVVHRNVNHPSDKWFASCGPLFNQSELKPTDLEDAKGQAVARTHISLQNAIGELIG